MEGETRGEKLDPKSVAFVKARRAGEKTVGRSAGIAVDSLARLEGLRRGDQVIIPLAGGEQVSGKVNVVQEEAGGWVRVGGELTGGRAGTFALSANGTKLGGMILLRREEIAYAITGQGDGAVLMQEKLLSEVMCYPIPRPKVEPVPVVRSLAVQGIPPILSSRPTATAVLYLDFDGETVNDPLWNGGNTIVAQPSPLGSSEIMTVWNRVKEDYIAFDIDVTTDVSRYNNAPVGRRMRCIITPTDTAYPGAGGVAYIGCFSESGQGVFSATIPCWVFTSDANSVSEAVSHELGHTLGLDHDGRTSPPEEYYYGHGSGAVSWAPIMGVGYDAQLVQWSKGEYANANRQEDDIAIIANTANGFGFAADEAGNSLGAAATLNAPGGVVNQPGVISGNGDVDYYAFAVSAATTVTINADPASPSPDLDIRLELQNSSGTVLASSNPDTALNAVISYSAPPGTYYLKIQGTGRGDVLGDGYSSYGSMGYYSLTGSIAAGSGETAYVTGKVLGTVRNNYTGYVGMRIAVGASPITVTQLGRIFVSGNSGTHLVKLVNASNGSDVAGGAVSIAMSGGTAGQFRYANFSSPVVLAAGATYYLMTQETSGGDSWYDYNTTVTTASVATELSGVFGPGGGAWTSFGTAGQTFGPVDFKYSSGSGSVVTVAATDATAGEPGSGQGTGTFTFSRTGSTAAALTVNYTVGGTASSGSDYASIGTSVGFAAGSATVTKTVSVTDDTLVEGDETVVVTLASGSGYTAGSPATATVTIQDDDSGTATAYVTGRVLGTVRNNYTGYVGMRIAVGASPITVTQLGRIFVSGNSGTHLVKLVNASNGSDVAGGSVSVAMSGGTAGQFKYASLSSPVVLAAGATYYLMTQETSGGDSWYDYNTTVTTASVATELSAVFGPGGGAWTSSGTAGQTFGPVDFKYSSGAGSVVTVAATDATAGEPGSGQGTGTFTFSRTGSTAAALTVNYTVGGTASSGSDYASIGTSVGFAAGSATVTKTVSVTDDTLVEGDETVVVTLASGSGYTAGSPATATVTIQDDDSGTATAYVTGRVLGTVRNNYTGFVGMRIAVGASPITVTQLGRIFVSGNSGTHLVKLVNASNGSDVAGGSVSVAMSGGTAGQFRYASLSSPVVLAAGATYYLMTQETSGGDSWYDYNTTVTTTSVANELSAVYGSGGGSWNSFGSAGQTYGPVDFKYSGAAINGAGTVPATGQTVADWRTVHFSPHEMADGLADDLADADGDGVSNLLEYGRGTDPRKVTAPLVATLEADGLALTFARPKGLPGITYTVESSDDFVTWMPLTLELVSGGDPETLRAHDDLSTGDPSRRVIRLRVTREP